MVVGPSQRGKMILILRTIISKKDTGQTQSYSKKIQAESRDGTKKIQAKNKHWRKWRSWRYRQYRQYRHAKIQMRIVRIMRNLTFLTFLSAIFVGRLADRTKRIRIKSGAMDIRVELETKRARVASHPECFHNGIILIVYVIQ